jgi:5-methylcytosine-specific restriction endonuclease McrA
MEAIHAGGCQVEPSSKTAQESSCSQGTERQRNMETVHPAINAKCVLEKGDGGLVALAEDGLNESAKLAEKGLTDREVQAWIAYLRLGTLAAVSIELSVRYDTAKNYIRECKRKLGIVNNSAAPSGVTESYLMAVLSEQGHRCALSGMALTPRDTALDHKVALSDGGKHERGNVWFLHRMVNDAKNSMGLDEFIQMCRRISEYQR